MRRKWWGTTPPYATICQKAVWRLPDWPLERYYRHSGIDYSRPLYASKNHSSYSCLGSVSERFNLLVPEFCCLEFRYIFDLTLVEIFLKSTLA